MNKRHILCKHILKTLVIMFSVCPYISSFDYPHFSLLETFPDTIAFLIEDGTRGKLFSFQTLEATVDIRRTKNN